MKNKFEVKAKEVKQFTDFLEAKKYYDGCTGEKAIWDITHVPELIDLGNGRCGNGLRDYMGHEIQEQF